MRILRGQVEPNKQEGIVDFAWLTKEEVKEKVSPEYWAAVEPMLSDY
jgi:large subunit ribosomal protein L46